MTTPLRAYADAFVHALPKGDAVAAFDAVADVVRKTKQLRSFLEDVSVPIASRRKALQTAFPDAEDETVNFFALLASDGRMGDLDSLASHIRTAAAAKHGKRHAIVTSAVPLTPKETERIADALGKKLGTDIQLEERIDPSVLAGIRITADAWTFDASLKGKLDRLHHALTV